MTFSQNAADPVRTGEPRLRRSRRRSGLRGIRGFTMVELVVVVGLIGILILVATPFIFRIFKREKLRSAVQEVYSQVLAARMQAIRRNTPVVVYFNLVTREMITWADLPPNDYIQNAGEPTINQWRIPDSVLFTYAPGGAVDDAKAIAFDQYGGNAALVDRIIFLGDGTLLPPQAANSVQPAKPVAYTATVKAGSINCVANVCRGIYLSDRDSAFDPGRNVFRISVDDFGISGKASLLKWLPTSFGGNAGETNYVPGSPWVWNE